MYDFLVRFLIATAAIILYYRLVVGRLGPLSRRLPDVLRLGRHRPLRDVSAALNLPVAALAQALFCLALLRITGVELWPLLTSGLRPVLVLYGVLLGVGEMAVATFFCRAALQTVGRRARTPELSARGGWDVVARGGWMRYHLKTVEVTPLPLAAFSVLLYVSVEEIVFRGVLLQYLSPGGAALSLLASVLLFVMVQAFHMPDWRAAMFPIIGAIVLGVVHAALFLAVPTIVPLIVAHLVFFFSAVI